MYKEEHAFRLYHYCLMGNHVHLVIEPTENTNMGKMMKQINLSYMHYYRRKYKYFGHFWQGRYKSLLIDRSEYMLMCGKYIELNPVRAKIVKTPEEYKWSSYRAYISAMQNKIVDKDPEFERLGNTEEERIQRYKAFITHEINLNQKYLGDESYINRMEMSFGVKNSTNKRGRPRKGEKDGENSDK